MTVPSSASLGEGASEYEQSDPQGGASSQHQHVHQDGSHEEHLVPRISIIPHRHTKVVHLIRHGQGFHNVAGHADHEQYKSFEWLDAHLTDFGWKQAFALGQHIRSLGSAFHVDAIIVSPLTRTLETAAGVFGSGRWQAGERRPAFMLEQTEVPGKCAAQQAISAAGCPPIIAWEGCREHLGEHPCDKRRPIRDIAPHFPAADFSLVEQDEDVLWKLEHRETHAEIKRRGVKFMQWLMSRPERCLAVVSHSSFIFFAMQAFGHTAAPAVQTELHKWYENAEMRSVVLADEGGAHAHPDPLHFHGGHSVADS